MSEFETAGTCLADGAAMCEVILPMRDGLDMYEVDEDVERVREKDGRDDSSVANRSARVDEAIIVDNSTRG